jgi:spermidine/putrescine transport system permease protein
MNEPSVAWRCFLGAMVVFMISPLLILFLFSFSESSLLSLPITGLTLAWFERVFSESQFWASLENSLIITGSVGAISTVIGTMGAFGLTRMRPVTASVGLLTLTLPVMVPPLVLGVMSLTYFSGIGIKLGLQTVILAHLTFTQPLVVMIVYARMATFDYATVHSARDLGASHLQAFLTVTLPIIQPTVIGAALVAMALSLDDFLVTFFTIGGGNTLPTLLWGMLRKIVDPTINVVAVVLMTLTISVSIIALWLTRYRG